jgi:hypothetical protein
VSLAVFGGSLVFFQRMEPLFAECI